MSELKKNQVHEVVISGMTAEGSGVARVDGFALFVPDTAVGDFCQIKIIKLNKSFGYARLEKILAPSKDRVELDCPSFVHCGGCTYRHISYQAELALKEELVRSAFLRIGGFSLDISPIIGAKCPDRYRNKAQYPVGVNENKKAVSGFYAKRSHRIIEAEDCLLQPEFFSQIQSKIMQFINKNNISVYDEGSGKGLLRHIYIRHAQKTDEVMVCLVASSFSIPKIEELVSCLTFSFKNIKSIVINKNEKNTNVILGEECRTVYGSNTITDILCGIKIEISPLSFYQVNPAQTERLYEKAIEYAELCGEETLLDLYCGAGTIGLSAAGRVKRLIGVEIVAPAIQNAKENALKNGIENAEFICSDAGQAAEKLAKEGIAPDVIIVDPPRKGLDLAVIDAIAEMAPKRLVMVSCNPATAARDCKLLNEKGYEVKAVTPVDMFPRTGHVECVVLLSKVQK